MSLLVSVELLEVHVGPLGVLLLRVFVQRVEVAEDEVQLVVLTTLVGSKHEAVGGMVLELLLRCRIKRVNRVIVFSSNLDSLYQVILQDRRNAAKVLVSVSTNTKKDNLSLY